MIACTSPAGTSRESPLRISLSSPAACRLETDSILPGPIGEELGPDLQRRLGALEICLLLPPLGLLPGAALHLATRELGFERVFQRQNPGLARPGGHSSTAFLSSIFSTTRTSAPLPWAKA